MGKTLVDELFADPPADCQLLDGHDRSVVLPDNTTVPVSMTEIAYALRAERDEATDRDWAICYLFDNLFYHLDRFRTSSN